MIIYSSFTQWTRDVPGTSESRPFWTSGRPMWTDMGRPGDVESETNPVRPFLVHFGRPKWTAFGLKSDVLFSIATSVGRRGGLEDELLDF